jgi:RNA polymerase sigma factor (sigma-70 family)
MQREEEAALLLRAQSGDAHARNALLLQFQRLAYSHANKFSASYPNHRDDIEQEALIALDFSIMHCDPSKGLLYVYADIAIRGWIIRYVKRFVKQTGDSKNKPVFVGMEAIPEDSLAVEGHAETVHHRLDCDSVYSELLGVVRGLERSVITLGEASLSHAEIAERLGISAPAAFAARVRGINRVRKHKRLAGRACMALFGFELTTQAPTSSGTE